MQIFDERVIQVPEFIFAETGCSEWSRSVQYTRETENVLDEKCSSGQECFELGYLDVSFKW